jgi:PAS domain-containing protein
VEQAPFSSSEYVRLFFDLFEASSNVVFIIRMSDGVVLDANEYALSLWGVKRESALGGTMQELGLWATPRARDVFFETLRATGRVRGFLARFRTRWSEEYTLELSATLAPLRGEEVALGVGVLAKSN